jgi:hypothetical protein
VRTGQGDRIVEPVRLPRGDDASRPRASCGPVPHGWQHERLVQAAARHGLARSAQACTFAALLSAGVMLTGTIAAVIAALAALATVIYARRTVVDGRDAHRELMSAQKEAREGFATAHGEEMAERQRALAAEISLQRLVLADRVAAALIDMARTAHSETLAPPLVINGRRGTFIPSLQAQLRAELAVFYALGGPTLSDADDLAQKAYSATTLPIEMLKLAQNSLGELQRLAGKDEQLKLA